jgi:hypothetical protein
VCSIPYSQSYKVHGHKPKMQVNLSFWSPHSKMFDSVKFFSCRVYNLHVKIIKHIQASNEQYKFRASIMIHLMLKIIL